MSNVARIIYGFVARSILHVAISIGRLHSNGFEGHRLEILPSILGYVYYVSDVLRWSGTTPQRREFLAC